MENKSMSRIEKERKFLFELNSAVHYVNDSDAFFSAVIKSLRSLVEIKVPPHFAILDKAKTNLTITLDTSFPDVDQSFIEHIDREMRKFNPMPLTDGFKKVMERDEPTMYSIEELKTMFVNEDAHNLLESTGVQSSMFLPLKLNSTYLGFFGIFSPEKDSFGPAYFDVFRAVGNHISVAVQNNLYLKELIMLRDNAVQEKNYLEDEIKTDRYPTGFVGKSKKLIELKEKIEQVAGLDTTVLIVGETGTGKELVARSLHNHSGISKPMVKINCASLPAQLIESELFGHEKGSFTGAFKRSIGKFEMANNGIIFLDEIGEMPLELQPKLLRVLQEKEVVRIGGTEPIKLNVKIIVATNRDLLQLVEEGKYRSDLYHRLSVFPITLDPLKERKEEIPDLADHFLNQYSKKLGKSNLKFSRHTMPRLLDYSWPGNVRELQHVIEKEVILAKGTTIDITPNENRNIIHHLSDTSEYNTQPMKTLVEFEKEIILRALDCAKGKIRGINGAAQLLDVHPNTLDSKIKKLGIEKRYC